jgi:VWFA-related protein
MNARVLFRFVPLAAIAVVLVPATRLSARADVSKTIYVSVLDQAGKPVKDMTAAELRILEDGVERPVTGAAAAKEPLSVALLADTTKEATEVLQDLRTSLLGFVKAIHAADATAAVSLMEFGQAATTAVPYTESVEELTKGINHLVGKQGANSVLLEGLIDAGNNLAKRPSGRRAIVVVNLEPGTEQSREDPKKIVETMRKSVAQLWVVSYQRGTAKASNRDLVLNQLSKTTGGTREFIVGISALEPVLVRYADILTSEYAVTYGRADSSKAAQEVRIGTTRPGVTLHASGFPPQ